MNFIYGLALALLCVPAWAEQKTPEGEIAALEAQMGQAMIHRDVDTLSALVGDEWTIQQDSEQTGNKAGFIDDIRSGRLIVTSFKLRDVRIRVFGQVAIVQAFDDEISSYGGKDGSGTFSWMDVWLERDGHWISVATQLTKVRSNSPAEAGIDAGNQAWIDGMKTGNIEEIASTYSAQAVDCTVAGACFRGRAAIAEHMRHKFASLGRAESANVKSMGSNRQGDFIYEWGRAEASFGPSKTLVDDHLTAWHKELDGSWKISRNLVLSER